MAVAWQFALLSKSVVATLPELHPARAAVGSASSPAASPQTTTNATRDIRKFMVIARPRGRLK
jgi:hypothetical protein